MKRIILCITMVLMFACMLPVVTACAETESQEFIIKNGVLKKYKGTAAEVVVPEGVTKIGSYCFGDNKTIVSVVLPESVKTIQNDAFTWCVNLESVTFGKKLTTIETDAFWCCKKLKNISSLKHVKTIGDMAFSGCEELEDIGSLDSLKKIGMSAFSNTRWLENEQKKSPMVVVNGMLLDGKACVGEVVVPRSVVEIIDDAFSFNQKVTGVTIPDTVKSIGSGCFGGCYYLRYVRMEDSVESIGTYLFEDCYRMRNVRLSAGLKEIPDGTWFESGIRYLTIPQTIQYMDEDCLLHCQRLEKVSVAPDWAEEQASRLVVVIGNSGSDDVTVYSRLGEMDEKTKTAILREAKLEELALEKERLWLNPGEVYTLAMNSEAKCDSWKSDNPSVAKVDRFGKITANQPGKAVITASLFGREYHCTVWVTGNLSEMKEETPADLFSYKLYEGEMWITGLKDKSLTQVRIPEQIEGHPVERIKEGAFASNENLIQIVMPDSVKEIGERAFQECSNLREIKLSESLTNIHSGMFLGCESLRSIRIPESVMWIYDNAFYGCTGLKEVNLSEGLDAIRDFAFWGCESLTSIRIPESVTGIGKSVFWYCTSLSEVELSEGLNQIGIDAFYKTAWMEQKEAEDGCFIVNGILYRVPRSVEGVFRIPEGVTTIGDYAFYECRNLTGVEIPEGVTWIGRKAFFGCSSLAEVRLPEGVKYVDSYAFSDCTSLQTVALPEGITTIGYGAFANCSSLTEVKIPEGVERIDDYAFFNCISLERVTLPVSVKTIYSYAFENCNSALEFIVPKGSYAEEYVKRYHTKK